ncbi:MAG: DUF11 domain-containing protein [Betaproteobacteria bacterium]|nr:DUF11 domain-containing protein [Betaproteobacteria bacterium]
MSAASFNLIGTDSGHAITNGVDNNQVGTAVTPLNPLLGPLASNGGPTQTRALLAASPAINAGANPFPLAFDQRGDPYLRDFGGQPDIGAYELQPVADMSVTKVDTPDPVTAGTNLAYAITIDNAGPTDADSVSLSDTLPAGTTFVSLAAPGGWLCTTPAVGAGGTVSCSIATLAPGTAAFTLTVAVGPAVSAATVLSNTATVTSAAIDPNPGNESATAMTTVAASANLIVAKFDSPDPATAGTNLTYAITLDNAGPSNAASVSLSDTLPAGTTFVSLSAPGGWTCTTPPVGAGGSVSCGSASFTPGGTAVFTLVVAVGPSVSAGTVLSNTATVTSTTPDPNQGNESGTASTTVAAAANLTVAKVDTPDPVTAGATLTYTITLNNAGPSNAASTAMSDTLPAGTTFVSLAAPGGWSCATPPVSAGGTVSCSIASLAPGNAVFTLTVAVDALYPAGTQLSNTATASSSTPDPGPGNESATATTVVLSPSLVSGTKAVVGTPVVRGNVTYTVVLTNNGVSAQQDNPGDEFTDVLPPELALLSATASSGVISTGPNTVYWNGAILAGDSVTITIVATVTIDAAGQAVGNQGGIHYDGDGNGTNETADVTDDPNGPGGADVTVFTPVGSPFIPTLDRTGLLLLILALAGLTFRRVRMQQKRA